MTASEKLRALAREAAGIEAATVPVNPSDLGYVQYNEPEERLMDALPLIADVVEAGEVAVERDEFCPFCEHVPATREDRRQHTDSCPLIALREHLESK